VLSAQLNARQQPTCSVNNPTGNAFVCEETDLLSVHQAQRLAAPELNRVWRIKNPSRQHPYRYQHAVCTSKPLAD
jgi:Cu2+-containing amine oxidase